jgi:hypothetical protein
MTNIGPYQKDTSVASRAASPTPVRNPVTKPPISPNDKLRPPQPTGLSPTFPGAGPSRKGKEIKQPSSIKTSEDGAGPSNKEKEIKQISEEGTSAGTSRKGKEVKQSPMTKTSSSKQKSQSQDGTSNTNSIHMTEVRNSGLIRPRRSSCDGRVPTAPSGEGRVPLTVIPISPSEIEVVVNPTVSTIPSGEGSVGTAVSAIPSGEGHVPTAVYHHVPYGHSQGHVTTAVHQSVPYGYDRRSNSNSVFRGQEQVGENLDRRLMLVAERPPVPPMRLNPMFSETVNLATNLINPGNIVTAMLFFAYSRSSYIMNWFRRRNTQQEFVDAMELTRRRPLERVPAPEQALEIVPPIQVIPQNAANGELANNVIQPPEIINNINNITNEVVNLTLNVIPPPEITNITNNFNNVLPPPEITNITNIKNIVVPPPEITNVTNIRNIVVPPPEVTNVTNISNFLNVLPPPEVTIRNVTNEVTNNTTNEVVNLTLNVLPEVTNVVNETIQLTLRIFPQETINAVAGAPAAAIAAVSSIPPIFSTGFTNMIAGLFSFFSQIAGATQTFLNLKSVFVSSTILSSKIFGLVKAKNLLKPDNNLENVSKNALEKVSQGAKELMKKGTSEAKLPGPGSIGESLLSFIKGTSSPPSVTVNINVNREGTVSSSTTGDANVTINEKVTSDPAPQFKKGEVKTEVPSKTKLQPEKKVVDKSNDKISSPEKISKKPVEKITKKSVEIEEKVVDKSNDKISSPEKISEKATEIKKGDIEIDEVDIDRSRLDTQLEDLLNPSAEGLYSPSVEIVQDFPVLSDIFLPVVAAIQTAFSECLLLLSKKKIIIASGGLPPSISGGLPPFGFGGIVPSYITSPFGVFAGSLIGSIIIKYLLPILIIYLFLKWSYNNWVSRNSKKGPSPP